MESIDSTLESMYVCLSVCQYACMCLSVRVCLRVSLWGSASMPACLCTCLCPFCHSVYLYTSACLSFVLSRSGSCDRYSCKQTDSETNRQKDIQTYRQTGKERKETETEKEQNQTVCWCHSFIQSFIQEFL